MAAFVSGEVTLSATSATKIVDAADFDRRVYLHGDAVRIAFTSAAVPTGAKIPDLSLEGQLSCSIVLPADEELWAYHGSGVVVSYLATTTS